MRLHHGVNGVFVPLQHVDLQIQEHFRLDKEGVMGNVDLEELLKYNSALQTAIL